MTDIATPSATTLIVRRTVNASRDRVFEAWLTPDILRKIMAPEGVTVGALSIDTRAGGALSVEMKTPNGDMVVRGVYREIRKPERIVFTWKWDEDDVADEHESQVTLDFNERGAQTEVVLTHERLKSEESRDSHAGGWTDILDNLATVVAAT
jgi:uncharacterized protein YndB with AHSA1/START domain